ncbi:outer membrane protein assembly factor BamB [Thermochromatium tepidum]|uniref:Outer membrane protein assembly factor BamB n=1 Tax=Thermochromatium tepidum ATCC 43061 TaxID=316276 RepID=A0A6I6EB78_THETI|nr:outer membrane protein assembly factor BamB [Thermochromatium tepidum]QGU32556.1 outer membrane protein assembly factor BamB [Thermochromatium tepidum ATCC 43061]
MMRFRLGFLLLRLSLILALVMLLTGCGGIPWFGKEKDPTPPSPLPTLAQETRFDTLWSTHPTRGTEGRRLYLVPAFADGRLYVADARGRVVALAADSGRLLWQRETGLTLSGGPEVAGDRLVLGTSQGEVVALSTQDGREFWRAQLGSEVLSVPRFGGNGQVFVHTLDDSLHGLNAATGQLQWRIDYPPPVLTLRGSSTPALTEDGIIVGLSGGKLVKLDPKDGLPIWEVTISHPSGRSELARITDIDADPILVGSRVYVGAYNGDLAAVDLDRGNVLWRRELSVYAGLTSDADGIYVTDSKDQVWGAEMADGAGRWKQDQLRYRRLTAPALIGERLLVGDFEGYLHLLDKRDGRLVGRMRLTKAPITARPLVVGNRIYVYADDGTLVALTLGATMPVPDTKTPASRTPTAESSADRSTTQARL